MTFGEKLREERKKSGLTQAELSQKSGVALRTIANYERGTTYPKSRETYTVLAQILHVDANYLHNETDDFLSDATASYGLRGERQAASLIQEVTGLFAGGELAEEDKDAMMQAIQDAYWISKKNNKKFAPKNNKD